MLSCFTMISIESIDEVLQYIAVPGQCETAPPPVTRLFARKVSWIYLWQLADPPACQDSNGPGVNSKEACTHTSGTPSIYS